MPYSEKDHDRALARLMADVSKHPERIYREDKPEPRIGICLCLTLVVFMLGILVLLTGCNTVAGVAADIESAARGTQQYLAKDVDGSGG